MSEIWVIIIAATYLIGLFVLAWWGDREASKNKKWTRSAWIYALSLAVYCTAWTFYGSVGEASVSGLNYAAIYIGPSLIIPLSWIVWRRMIRINKMQGISSFPEFLATRYGKSTRLGVLVSLLMLVGVIPYISIQLKAISESFLVITENDEPISSGGIFSDSSFYFAVALSLFTILFSTRKLESTERNSGLILAVAAESVVKLLAFLLVGIFATFFVLDDPLGELAQAVQRPEFSKLFHIDSGNGYTTWFFLILLSMGAFLLLPRQFQVGVVENANEKHLFKAIWVFPLYLLLINIFVIPVTFVGNQLFEGQGIAADTYVLAIPLSTGQDAIAVIAFLGGFAASTSMIIVSSIALGLGLSNNIIIPGVIRTLNLKTQADRIGSWAKYSRRISIGLVILLAYIFFRLIAEPFSLVFIGLTSFVAVAQFLPATIGGLFWKGANRKGAAAGLVVGFVIWFYTLLLPILTAENGLLAGEWVETGPWGIEFLKPRQLFGLDGLDFIAHGTFWSLLFNTVIYIGVSLNTRQSSMEHNQAEVFVDVFQYEEYYESSIARKGVTTNAKVRELLERFHPTPYVDRVFSVFSRKYQVEIKEDEMADLRLVNFVERLLTGIIGAASARILLGTIIKEDEISFSEVMSILRESQTLIASNKELQRTSEELRKTSEALQMANEQLKHQDELKDEFLYTVTHELRTPLTTILAMSELLMDHTDMEEEERSRFLGSITQESERMRRLISQVLDLEKYESGKQKLSLTTVHLPTLVEKACFELSPQAKARAVKMDINLQESAPEAMLDQDRIKQVVLNLLTNAIKFAPTDEGEIKVSLYYIDGDLKFNVWDNGPGIAEEDQERIFDKFFQVRNKGTSSRKGSGLGLAISRRIIELHGGRIWVDSELGKWTRFSFLIPVRNTEST